MIDVCAVNRFLCFCRYVGSAVWSGGEEGCEVGRGYRAEIVLEGQGGKNCEYGFRGMGDAGEGLFHLFCWPGEKIVSADGTGTDNAAAYVK